MPDLVISGLGVTSAIGQGRQAFSSALLAGEHRFDVMRRPGRQWPLAASGDAAPQATRYLGAEIADLSLPPDLAHSMLRTASLSSQVALATLHEAWQEAALAAADPGRIGLFVGGSNFQQREMVLAQAQGARKFQFLRPTYGMTFLDSDLCGICTEVFGIRGVAYTIGGASASGQLAVLQAAEAVRAGQVDIAIALGAMMDLSCFEAQALRSLGAMGSDRYAEQPELACRPFDQARDGFIFGESCGAVVVERTATARRRGATPWARLAGWSSHVEGNRNPNPSLGGELEVINTALARAGWTAGQLDYVNPHASGSGVGDETELEALRQAGIDGAWVNTTKSITGHGLSAAGAVEIVATLLQMRAGRLHPSRNLEQPLASSCRIVGSEAVAHRMARALTLSFGFGGMNTALCLEAM
ncbi:polyketide beta-ketoacyl:ACP synthase [Massilia sp. PAMC28688]|uniref:beta-ketoacyl synthase N-terminal-like domain-containing protein n=1 Tax=Massilia sp. PAMC28688 TaxID=2861283 RepID=UPI001C625C1A|nr:beta-ketoacyl synthase N-terminal-like domain-containing protein [Massilia sp. PAMC28688]QYF93468.1 polyketide beta-ketoacyl:ACP synthase [Massilia sp. PAMC28688]